jgi:Transposase IS66 family
LAVWVGNSADLLEPLADAIGRLVLSAEVIFSDDTPVSMHARSQDHQSRRTDAMALERLAVTPDDCAFTTLDSKDESFTELV